MSEYPQITCYFKKIQQAQSKLTAIQKSKKLLQQFLNLGEVEKIQTAVEERMGPYMCDNTQKQSNAERDAFIDVLEDFKKQSRMSTKLHNQQYIKMKEQLSLDQRRIEQQFQQYQSKWNNERLQIKEQSQLMGQSQKVEQLKSYCDRVDQHLQQSLKQTQDQLQVQLLQLQVDRRKSMIELYELLNF